MSVFSSNASVDPAVGVVLLVLNGGNAACMNRFSRKDCREIVSISKMTCLNRVQRHSSLTVHGAGV